MFNKYEIDDLKEVKACMQIPRDTFKVALIDDEPANDLLKRLKKLGFSVKYFPDIGNIKELEQFEIVVCDIHGVGKSFGSEYEGAYLIKEISVRYPLKYIIRYSIKSFTFDSNRDEFFKLTDDAMSKRADISEWSGRLDKGIESISDPVYVWRKARRLLEENSISINVINSLEKKYIKSLIKRNVENFNNESFGLKLNYPDSIATIDAIGTYLGLIISVLSLNQNKI